MRPCSNQLLTKSRIQKHLSPGSNICTSTAMTRVARKYSYKDGRIIDRYSAPVTGADGKYYGRVWYFRDITERRQMEQKTRALTLRYQALMQTSVDGIHVMDEQGNIVEAKDAFCRMLGYTQEEVVRLNVADWDAQWQTVEARKRFREFIGRSDLIETVHRRKDGVLIEVEISASGVELDGCNY